MSINENDFPFAHAQLHGQKDKWRNSKSQEKVLMIRPDFGNTIVKRKLAGKYVVKSGNSGNRVLSITERYTYNIQIYKC